jgi:hypothetical protein
MKTLITVLSVALLTACGSMKEVSDRKNYAQPDWYQDCQQAGTTGFFWWKKEMVYACGGGEAKYAQHAEEEMYAIALNNFAKRINGNVDSETKIEFNNDKKTSRTMISYTVSNTKIREHIKTETAQFTMDGRHYTFVKLEMPKAVFNDLITEAKAKEQLVAKQ